MNPLNQAANGERPMGTTLLHASRGLRCHLGFYREGSVQPMHSHPTPTVSLLLSGSLREEVAGREVAAAAWSMSIKPADVRHRDVYGGNGTVILSIAIDDPEPWAAASPLEWTWQPLGPLDSRALIASLATPDRVRDATYELLALGRRSSRRAGSPPKWMCVVEERLRECPDQSLHLVAAEAGVHPVSLARAFRRWYGVTPSAYRLYQRTSAAIGAGLWSAKAASAIAHEVGFADQSHMARSIRAATGHTLSELRRLALRSLRPQAEVR